MFASQFASKDIAIVINNAGLGTNGFFESLTRD